MPWYQLAGWILFAVASGVFIYFVVMGLIDTAINEAIEEECSTSK